MKKTITIAALLLFCMTGIFVSAGYGHRNSAPTFDCMSCHPGDAEDIIQVRGIPEAHVPGKTYEITVTAAGAAESMSESRGGFAFSASAGRLIARDRRNTQVIDGILTHTREGSELRQWTFFWKAPSPGKDVDFTVMAIAANGDFSSAGDSVGAAGFSSKAKQP